MVVDAHPGEQAWSLLPSFVGGYMSTSWLKYIGVARDKRLAEIRADIKDKKDCREHAQYLVELVEFMLASTKRRSDGLN